MGRKKINDEEYANLLTHTNQFLKKRGFVKKQGLLYEYVEPFLHHKKPVLLRCIAPKDRDTVLTELYKDPKYSRNGRDTWYNAVRQKYANISKREAFEWLKTQETYQIHKVQQKEKILRPEKITRINVRFQMDLIDMSMYNSRQNKWKKWILNVIDIFSRKAYSVPIASKTAQNTRDALLQILEENFKLTGRYPATIASDRGPEFLNGLVQDLFKEKGIKHIINPSYMPVANSHIERFNQTLKRLIFQHAVNNQWYDVLDDCLENYNNSVHSFTQDTPNRLHVKDKVNDKQKKIVVNHVNKYSQNSKVYPELEEGDKVRIHILVNKDERKKAKFAKKYTPQWSKEVYTVKKIYNAASSKLKKKYVLTLDGKDFERTLYRHDLQKNF